MGKNQPALTDLQERYWPYLFGFEVVIVVAQ